MGRLITLLLLLVLWMVALQINQQAGQGPSSPKLSFFPNQTLVAKEL